MEFCEALRAFRREANISQRELATKVGVDFSYISKLENGHLPSPSADTIVKICSTLGIEPEKLLSLSGKIPTDIQEAMSSSQAAQHFLRDAKLLQITEEEWSNLRIELHRLREG